MARIWFIQFADGYFAVDKKYFEFQKASEKLDEDIKDVNPTTTTLSSNFPAAMNMSEPQVRLMDDVSYWFREMPVIVKIKNRDPRELMHKLEDWKNFALAWNGLRTRSTTKADDLLGILAVVVDLSAGEILKLPPESRLKAILRSQSTLPLPLLYQSTPKLLDNKGFDTWAPSGIKGDRLDLHSGYVTLSSKGLLLDPGKWAQLCIPQAILVDSYPVSSRFLQVSISGTQTVHIVELLLSGTSLLPDIAVCSLCFIFHDHLTVNDPNIGTFAPGACVVIHSLTRSNYQASYLCPIRVFASESTKLHIYDPSMKTVEAQPARLAVSGSIVNWQTHSIFIDSGMYHSVDMAANSSLWCNRFQRMARALAACVQEIRLQIGGHPQRFSMVPAFVQYHSPWPVCHCFQHILRSSPKLEGSKDSLGSSFTMAVPRSRILLGRSDPGGLGSPSSGTVE